MFKRAEVEIEGITPLLVGRLDDKVLLETITKKGLKHQDLMEVGKKAGYITGVDGKETLYIPARAVYACILNMSKHYKIGKSRFSSLLAGSVRVEPEKIPLNKTEYEVDIRAVRGGRGTKKLKARAKVWPWKAKFQLVAEKPLSIQQWNGLEEVISEAGTMNGRGHYGMFRLKSFKVLEE